MVCWLKTKKGDVLFRENVEYLLIITRSSSSFIPSSSLSLVDFAPILLKWQCELLLCSYEEEIKWKS